MPQDLFTIAQQQEIIAAIKEAEAEAEVQYVNVIKNAAAAGNVSGMRRWSTSLPMAT